MDDEWTKMEQHKITKEIPPTSYKYRETVRGKEARKAMHGKDCPCCADVSAYHSLVLCSYFDMISMSSIIVSLHKIWHIRHLFPPS